MRPKVLVIEPDQDLARLFQSILMVEGYNVEVVNNPDATEQMLKHYEPDIVIYDWPSNDTKHAEKIYDSNHIRESIPKPTLLICDSLPSRDVRNQLWDAGIPTIEKPFDLQTFCLSLEALLPVRERVVGV